MNRDDLKYRVWSVSDEKYITNVALLPSGEIFYISDNLDGSVELWEPDPPVGVERCTGRHDVAGKLIYEDDVVVVPKGDELVEYVVKWRNSMWCLYHWPHEYKPLDDFDYRQNGVRQRVEGPCRQCRIVGNIHDKEKNEQKANVQ